MPTKKYFLPFWIFAISVAFALTLPTLIKDGMFMDAMLYTSVSHNMSHGMGSFWFPYFDEHNVAGLTSFHEQPPLVFTIQSFFFRLFGDSRFVERFYVVFCMICNIILMSMLWKSIFKKEEIADDKQEFSKAVDYYKKSIVANPGDYRIYFNLGNTYLKIGKDEKAIQTFEKCISIAPTYKNPYQSLTIYYKAKNNLEKASYYEQKLKALN